MDVVLDRLENAKTRITIESSAVDNKVYLTASNEYDTKSSQASGTYARSANRLFGLRGMSSLDYYEKVCYYEAKLEYENEPFTAMVPCYRKADGVIGMYDLVAENFVAGSGNLTKGADV